MNKEINLDWKLLSLNYSLDVNDALQQQHHAAQFIAMVGKYLVRQQSDDSNTNMQYLIGNKVLIGNKLSNGLRVALHLPNLKLQIIDNSFTKKYEIPLKGKTKSLAFIELKQALEKFDIKTANLVDKLHYEIPNHDLDKGLPFNILDLKSLLENTFYRLNSEIIINEIADNFEKASSVRVWPHHFDTGSYIPFEYNAKNEIIKSIGIGWAIPDEMVKEPYYYLSFWSENLLDDIINLPSPDAGEWVTTGWKGGVLKLSEIIKEKTPEAQYKLVKTFFKSGIKILNNHFL